jgi:transposase-like protein
MGERRRQFSEQVKFKVALEAAKELRTINEIASAYDVHPNQVHGLRDYFQLYNYERPHQSLAYRTPANVHCAIQGVR